MEQAYSTITSNKEQGSNSLPQTLTNLSRVTPTACNRPGNQLKKVRDELYSFHVVVPTPTLYGYV